MPHSPEQEEFALGLKQFPGDIPEMDANRLSQLLQMAPAYRNCYYLFWTSGKAKFLITFRQDRLPDPQEITPIMECLFDMDGPDDIHEVGQTQYSREFSQHAYTERTGVDVIADAMEKTAEKDSYSDAFDFERTDTAKRMRRAANEKNGTG